jgi:aspartyl protease family protein
LTEETVPQALYLALLLVFVGSALAGRQLPVGKTLKMALLWVAIFAAGFALFAFRGEFSNLWKHLRTEATGASVTHGQTVRIPMADDGHFWVDASVNGAPVRFLVDSGASTTTVSLAGAAAANLQTGLRRDFVETANGRVVMKRSTGNRIDLGPIERPDMSVDINEMDSANVLGMNFLSSLSRWSVEGRWLVLVS